MNLPRRNTRKKDRCACDDCRICKQRIAHAKWYAERREERRAASAAYYAANRDRLKVEMMRRYWERKSEA